MQAGETTLNRALSARQETVDTLGTAGLRKSAQVEEAGGLPQAVEWGWKQAF